MFAKKKLRALVYVIRCGSILLMLTLISFGIISTITGRDVVYINQVALQGTRDQIFAKSVYALQYQPALKKMKAISDLQITLPLFEQEQALLLTDNNIEVQGYLQAVEGDFLALDSAVKAIIAHPNDPTNDLEISIVLSHEFSYLTQINAVIDALQQQSVSRTLQLGLIQIAIELASLSLILFLMFLNRHMFAAEAKEKMEVTTLTKEM